MTLTALNPEAWKKSVQAQRNAKLVAAAVCDTRFPEIMVAGDTVNFPYLDDVPSQTYTPGTAGTVYAANATQDQLSISTTEATFFYIDDTQQRQALVEIAPQMATQSANNLQQRIDGAVMSSIVSNASYSNTSGGSITTSGIADMFNDANSSILENSPPEQNFFAFVDPKRKNLVQSNMVANGFAKADVALEEGYGREGFCGMYQGFATYASNNIPGEVALTLADNPSNGETIVFGTITATFKTTPVSGSDHIKIGANAAATQSNLDAFIEGTGSGDGTDYYITADTLSKFRRRGFALGAFASDVGTLTGRGALKVSGTAFDNNAGNSVGTEYTHSLFGMVGAPALAIQNMPELKTVPQSAGKIGTEYQVWDIYGNGVFERMKPLLYYVKHEY